MNVISIARALPFRGTVIALLCCPALLFPAEMAGAGQRADYIYQADALSDGEFLKHWLVCGPFPNRAAADVPDGEWLHDRECAGLYKDHLVEAGGESAVSPLPGQRVTGPDGESRTWTEASAPHALFFLGDFMAPTTNQVAYAACWIDSDVAVDRLMGLGSSDGIRIWVNGQEIFRVHTGRTLRPNDNYFRLPLVAGRNQLLLKVGNGDSRWGFALSPVANADAVKSLIPRLKDVLRFDYRATDAGYAVTWGDPTVVGNLEGVDTGTVTLLSQGGDVAGQLDVRLGHPFIIPTETYPDHSYSLHGKVLWPYRGRVEIDGLLYQGDLAAEFRTLLSEAQPSIPPSRAADAYAQLVATMSHAERLNRFEKSPQAYQFLKAGMTHAINEAVELQNSPRPHDRLFPKPKHVGTSTNTTVQVTGNWTLTTADSIFDDSLDDALYIDWNERTGALEGDAVGHVYVLALETDLLATPIPELRGDDSEFREPADAIRERVPEHPEGYAIIVEPARIIVAGRQAAGAFYGLDTLLQLLAQDSALATTTIIDEPTQPTRASVLTLESFDDEFRTTIDELAGLRINQVFLPSSLYPDVEDSEIQPLLSGAYAYCRSRFIDPIPLIETFGNETLAARIDPNFLEGKHLVEYPVVVDTLRRIHLPFDRILVNESTTPQIRTGKGYKVLRVERDFTFESLAPPVIQLKGKAPVQTDETLLITADVVDHSLAVNGASCPSDTGVWLLTEQVLKKVYAHLSPTGIHIGQTGTGYLNQDSRCIAREMPNALLLSDAVQKSFDIVRRLDKRAQVFMWGDQFNPFQQAYGLDAKGAATYLPKDIIILDWWHHGATEFDTWRVTQGIRFFDQYGLKTLGVVRDDPLNIRQFATMNLSFPRRFQGIVHRIGDPANDGRYLAAQAGWEGATLLGMPLSPHADHNPDGAEFSTP